MAERTPILTVTIHDCEVQTFRSGGKGGQNQNKRDTGVRVIHHPSGARGESREERSQFQNKRSAFVRMVETPAFRYWVDVVTKRLKSELELTTEIEAELADPKCLRTEIRENDRWVTISGTAGGLHEGVMFSRQKAVSGLESAHSG